MSFIAGHARSRHAWTQVHVVAAVLFLCVASPVTGAEKETCYSRQHRDVIVDVRVALTKPGTTMEPRVTPSEKDCILSCCSQEVKPGLKCNLVVYKAHKPNDPVDKENCYLFHCDTEQDCPLMASKDVNTYDIFRGYMVPPAKVSPRVTAKPVPATTTTATTTTTTTTTAAPTTTTTTPTTTTTTTTTVAPTTTTTTTTPAPTTTTTTTQPTTTTTLPTTTTTEPPTFIIVTMPPVPDVEPEPTPEAATTTTTTTTTQPTTTTTTTTVPPDPPAPQATTVSTTTTTKAPPPPPPPAPHRPVRPPPRRPVKPGPHRTGPHPVKPQPPPKEIVTSATTTTTTTTTTASTTTTTTPTTTTTTPTTTTTTTTTTTIATTTTTTTPAPERTTSAFAAMDYELKAEIPDAFSSVGPVHGVAAGKAVVSRAAWKTSLVAVVLVGLAFVTMVLALVGRKAMESFDRRHYTRLELNDLHYEV